MCEVSEPRKQTPPLDRELGSRSGLSLFYTVRKVIKVWQKFAKWDPYLIEMLSLLQMHLEDAKFEELFEMSKKEWENVPQWKKNQKKKALELF